MRDSDSRLNPRERFAVEEWIQSGKAVHTIRDHPNHERPLNGGLIELDELVALLRVRRGARVCGRGVTGLAKGSEGECRGVKGSEGE